MVVRGITSRCDALVDPFCSPALLATPLSGLVAPFDISLKSVINGAGRTRVAVENARLRELYRHPVC